MGDLVTPSAQPEFDRVGATSAGWHLWLVRRAVHATLSELEQGRLVLHDRGETRIFGPGGQLEVAVHVHDPRFYLMVAWGGSLGAAEAFIKGYWSCSDLTTLIRLFLRNQSRIEALETGLASLPAALARWFHSRRRNTRRGARRNISRHYDLGNEFFSLFLDETWSYSCGIFPDQDASLEQASLNKLETVCRKLQLREGDHLVEVGGGWGGFALYAARHHGCRITTTTISKQQYDWASRAVQEAGLSDRISVLLTDYRDLKGSFDGLVSIEMIEAVGHQYLDGYFHTCAQLLKPAGRMLIQAIVISEPYYEKARGSVDFIKHYIFPGGHLPSLSKMVQSASRAGLREYSVEDITRHYPATLRAWRRGFQLNRDRLLSLGRSESFCRMWDYYFCYCEGGFLERYIQDFQVVFDKPARVLI